MENPHDLNQVTDDKVYFYTPRYYVLDNFSAYTVEIWGKKFSTAEHAFQWKKFSIFHPLIAEEIFNSESPSAVKEISDSHKDKVYDGWKDEKARFMEEILIAKAHQHEKVRRMLLESGSREIIENSPTDNYWGIGPDGTGQNMLGKLWGKVRNSFSAQ